MTSVSSRIINNIQIVEDQTQQQEADSTSTAECSSRRTIRAKTGCITCRLRKKRCDESKPFCQTCERLGIECLGFGKVRPEWLRGAKNKEQKEKVRSDLKRKVNKSRYRSVPKQSFDEEIQQNDDHPQSPHFSFNSIHQEEDDHIASLSPFDLDQTEHITPIIEEVTEWQTFPINQDGSNDNFANLNMISDNPPLPMTTTVASSPNSQQYEIIQSIPFELGMPRQSSTTSKQIEYLYHWLHAVLPIQYRFAAQRMAGLVTPLALTKPVILKSVGSLAALHLSNAKRDSERILSTGNNSKEGEDEFNSLVAMTSHSDSIDRLRSLIVSQNNNLTSEDVVIPALFAISYHLFSGGTSFAWREALAISQKCLSSMLIFASNNPQQPLITNTNMWSTYRPLIAVMIWMDIFGSITMGIGSPLLPAYRILLDPSQVNNSNYIEMSEIMGSDNATMLALAEIAALVEWKENEERNGQLSISKLVQKSMIIQQSLQFSHSNLNNFEENVSSLYQNVFRSATKVYLNSVINGSFPRVPEIEESVEETKLGLIKLEQFVGTNLIKDLNRGLILPITLAGCHSYKQSQKQIFRNALYNLKPEALHFGNSSSALKLMEEVWKKRERLEWEQSISFRNSSEGAGNNVQIQNYPICWRKTMADMGWEAGVLLI